MKRGTEFLKHETSEDNKTRGREGETKNGVEAGKWEWMGERERDGKGGDCGTVGPQMRFASGKAGFSAKTLILGSAASS